jgi:hypothetical protein
MRKKNKRKKNHKRYGLDSIMMERPCEKQEVTEL